MERLLDKFHTSTRPKLALAELNRSRRNIATVVCILVSTFGLALSARAQTIVTFDASGAGTKPGQGTFGFGTTPAGVIMGEYIDADSVAHGFVRSRDGAIISFDITGAGTGPGQGTVPNSINPAGVITGEYIDASGLGHGFVRAPDGAITTFDAPGAGIPPAPPCSPILIASSGTQGGSIDPGGTIAGQYVDSNGVFHGFLRSKDGEITIFDAPGAGTGSGQGTLITFGDGINPEGEIAGACEDTNCVLHGFVRAPNGTFTSLIRQARSSLTALASTRLGRLPRLLTRAVYFTAMCEPRMAPSRCLTLLAEAQVLSKVPSPSASTRPGISWELTLTRTAWTTVSCALRAVPSPSSMLQVRAQPADRELSLFITTQQTQSSDITLTQTVWLTAFCEHTQNEAIIPAAGEVPCSGPSQSWGP
jgi:hypothetical protein